MVNTINLVLDINKSLNRIIEIQEFDSNSRKLHIQLVDNLKPIDLTNNTINLIVKKPNVDTPYYLSCSIIDALKGVVEVVLTTDCASSINILDCHIEVIGQNNQTIYSKIFNIDIKQTIDISTAIEGTDNFTALTQALSKVNNLIATGGGSSVSQVQSDWNELDNTQVDYIKNKPINLVSDVNYVHTDNNYTTDEKNKLANQSGINTGDQDLSGLVAKTTTVNGHALSSNITISKSDIGLENVSNTDTTTTTNITDSANKRFVTDTQINSWSNKAEVSYVDNKVSSLVNSAPSTLDTLNELATALGDDPNFAATISTQIGNKVDKVTGKVLSTNDFDNTYKSKLDGLSTVASSGSYNDLSDKPTIPNYSVATESTDGLFSHTDKTKLDGILSVLTVVPLTSETYTASVNQIIDADATNNAITIALPSASTWIGKQIIIGKIDSSVNTVTILPNETDTINGYSSLVIQFKNSSVTLISVGNDIKIN